MDLFSQSTGLRLLREEQGLSLPITVRGRGRAGEVIERREGGQ